MMEQLAERRMQREEEAAVDVEEESEDEDEEGDEDDEDDEEEDEEDDDEEEVCLPCSILLLTQFTSAIARADHDRGAEDGGGQADVLHLCGAHVRAACAPGVPREGRPRAPTPTPARA